MKLTAELINNSPTYINPVKDRELDLSNNHIALIENLGATRDLNDSLNLCSNNIRVLGNFPDLPRLKSLYLANNRIAAIDHHLPSQLPSLTSLVLTNNEISEFKILEPLRELHLESLSLLNNPVMRKPHARLWCIWRIPSLRVLNLERVAQRERNEAKRLFETSKGKPSQLALEILDTESPAIDNTFVPGEGLNQRSQADGDEVSDIQQNINELKAKICEEMAQIEAMEEFI